MKRIFLLLLSLLLSAATPAPQTQGLLQTYSFYDQPDWEHLTSAVMFWADLDQNGVEEPVSFTLDRDEWTTAITWGESTVVLEEGDDLVAAAALDLDAESPFYNLLVTMDYGSDSYVTVELHPEQGQLVRGPVVEGGWEWVDGGLWFHQRTDFLGTSFGKRTYSGDGLLPDSDWLIMSYIPTSEEMEEDREALIDVGVLLHAALPVPCTVDGQPTVIPADTYVYRLGFRDDDRLTEVCLPDGTRALIACTVGEHGWPFLIDGRDALDYFDNLFFAD